MKSLETALRFGAPLIVMDVDKARGLKGNILRLFFLDLELVSADCVVLLI